MNYKHIYHAGNFADVIKHMSLIMLILHLQKKDKPFSILDCFAGAGIYDLKSTYALKTQENLSGVSKILDFVNKQPAGLPSLLNKYFDIIRQQPQGFYPGSPLIIKQLLRRDDKLIASELHKEEYLKLKQSLQDHRISIHHTDGYYAIKAFLPFKEKRGIVFLDPAFEQEGEFDKILASLKIIEKRSPSIPVLIWYPIKNIKKIEKFYNDCRNLLFQEILKIEFEVFTDFKKNILNTTPAMNKCGLIIVNPPDVSSLIIQNLDFLVKNIYDGSAAYSFGLLKGVV